VKPITPTLRWILFGLLCVAGIFNAMDRPVIAILKPDISADLGWNDTDFANLAFVTQVAAALSFLFTGWLVDKLGVLRSMVAGVTTWSLAAMAHGWAIAGWHVVAARIGLGATEAVQTPLTIKTVATLFPADKRSFAFGVGTAIAGLGTIAMPFFIPVIAAIWGWRGALIFGGIGGFVTLALWLWFARGVKFDDQAEDANRDFSDGGAPYGPILLERRTWAIVIAKALSDATWWLINFWLPDFYRKEFGLTTRLLEAGWSVNRVRKTIMLGSAAIVVPLPFVLTLDSFWPVAIMMGVVMAGHQGFSLSIFSIITDVVPRAKVGRVTAFGAFMGNMGGALIQLVTGAVLAAGLGYTPLFIFAAVSYLLALGWLHLLLPHIRRAEGGVEPAPV
jgi:ACS family hexuronate transporter-like MFS transporter